MSEQEQIKLEYTIGSKLERHRIKKKLTTAQVAKKTCISEKYIVAIEKGDMDSLPENAYAIGFIRTYANLLKIAPEPLVTEFKQFKKDNVRDEYKSYNPVQETDNKKYVYVAILILAIIAIYILINSMLGNDTPKTDETKTSVNTEVTVETSSNKNEMESSDTTSTQSNSVETATTSTASELNDSLENELSSNTTEEPQPIVTVDDTEGKIKFIALDDVDVKIYNNQGGIHYKGTLEKGRYVTAPMDKGFSIWVNNGGNLSVTFSGLYENKVIGEADIVLNKLILNKRNLRKHFK
ncbi:MAG: helix-turn-helix domain-containing protein [Alphaproteobacteria bacterium]